MSALVVTALSAVLLAPASHKCAGTLTSADELLPRAQVALRLAGTQQVGAGRVPGCIAIVVRTTGTARLVGLVLRGMQVPAEAVDIQVDERPVAGR